MSRRCARRPPGAFVGLLTLGALLAGGCSKPPPPAPRPPEAPRLLRLWQDNGAGFPVTPMTPAVTAPLPSVTPATDVAADAIVLDCDFRGGAEPAFYAVVPEPGVAEAAETLVYRRFTPEGGALRLVHNERWAAVTSLPVRGGEVLSVRLTGRVAGAGVTGAAAPVPVLAAVELRQAFDSSARLSPQQANDLLDPRYHATHVQSAAAGADPQDIELQFVTDRLTQEILVCVLAPTAGAAEFVASRLGVTRRHVAGFVAAGGEFPRLRRLAGPAGAVAITLDRDERKGLLALPGRGYACALGRSAAPRRLDLSLGVAPRDARIEGAITVRIEADGRLLHEERLTAPADSDAAAWRDLSLALPPTPDSSLALTLVAEGEGDDPPLAVFGHPEVRTRGAAGRPNVVLISLDTLRPDPLGCYGGDETISPRLDALAAEGLRFTQASSTSSYTLPSHGSMLTGQYPAVHGAVDVDDRLDAARSPFLARLLAEAGYVTAAFTGGGYVAPDYGFSEGFDRYSSNDPVWALDSVRGRQLLQTVSSERLPAQLPLLRRYAAPLINEWIARQDDGVPFFAFLHTYVCHNYAPNHDWLVRRDLIDEIGRETPFNHKEREAFNRGESVPQLDVVKQYMPYYEATIGMADEFVGGVLDALYRAGLLDDTLVIVTSDHGEEFGEHGFFGHGETLFEAATRVPLIVRLPRSVLAAPDVAAPAPGGAAGGVASGPATEVAGGASRGVRAAPVAGPPPLHQPAVVAGPISLVDLSPWILRLVGLPPDPRMAACADVGLDDLSPPRRSLLFLELDTRKNRLSAVREGHLKLHTLLGGTGRGLTEGQSELFDLQPDRGETHDVSAERVPDVQRLLGLLEAFHGCATSLNPRAARGAFSPDQLSPELQEQLRQNGYIGNPAAPTEPSPDQPGDKPADPPRDR